MAHAFKRITSSASKRTAFRVKKRYGSFINASTSGSLNEHGIVVVEKKEKRASEKESA